jgi:SAM-dependent methyltransferase
MAANTSDITEDPSLSIYHCKRTASKILGLLTERFPLSARRYIGSKLGQFEARRFQAGRKYCFELGGHRMKLTPIDFGNMSDEWRIWKECYLPNFRLEGKTVLDVGAGPGETALFYLLHGASKVICVEEAARQCAILSDNAKTNDWNVDILNGPFKVDMLTELRFDFMKMDIEGAEVELLNAQAPLSFPAVICLHYYDGDPAMHKLKNRLALRQVFDLGDACETIWRNW